MDDEASAGSAPRQLGKVLLHSNEPAGGSSDGDQDYENEMSDRENGDEIGVVTSGGFGPSVGAGIGMALLFNSMEVQPGMEVRIEHANRIAMQAQVTTLPFVRAGQVRCR
ncbi:MAG: glycine cleavage T C-terminal barrel domain-containing protein [Acidimicrobiales bacterium]